MKKTVTTLLVVATVFLCIPFNVFAVTSGGKTINSSSYSYNNGDVTTYVRVNGRCSEQADTVSGNGLYQYEHSFTVVLANNTHEFQVADTNSFTIDLYTGYADTFSAETTLTPSGNSAYRPSWSSETTSYSDNMTAPRLLFYSTGDYAGHVLISFTDSDLLVLNPNETRTYNFTIIFKQEETSNTYPINGNPLYSYFTYTGSVSMYSRPTGFTENTIEDFISNDSLPNTAIAYYQYLIEQGIEDQELLNEILDSLLAQPNNTNFGSNATSIITGHGFSTNLATSPLSVQVYATMTYPIPIDKSFNINGYDFSSPSYSNSSIYKVSTYIDFRISNTAANTYSSPVTSYRFNVNINDIMLDQGYYYSTDYTNIVDEGVTFTLLNGNTLYFTVLERESNKCLYPSGAYYRGVVRIDRYYVVENISGNITRPTLLSTSKLNVTNYVAPTLSVYNQSLVSSIIKNFADLRDLLTGNTGVNDDISDQASDNQTQEDAIHAQEQQWYQDNETAINAVGLSNYQFTGDQTSGLSGVTSQFTSVWNALDGWTNVYIFVLTLSLATFILRHRAETKATQKALDEYRPYSIGHLVRRRRSYH